MRKEMGNILYEVVLTIAALLTFMPLAQAEEENELGTSAMKMINVGDAFVQANNMKKALDLYNDALANSETPNEKWVATERLATTYIIIGKGSEALRKLDELMLDPNIVTDSTIMMNAYAKIGQLYYNTNDYVRSIKSFEKSQEYSKGSWDRKGKAIQMANMAKTLIVAGDIHEAEKLLNKSEETCKTYMMESQLAEIYESKAALYEQTGDYKKAYENKKKQRDAENIMAQNYKSDLLNEKSPWAFYQKTEIDANNEKRLKEAEDRAEQSEDDLTRMREYLLVALIVIAILAAISLFVWIKYRKRSSEIKYLASSNNEKKHIMSIIAHDFINPFNAMIGFAELQMQYAEAQDDTEMKDYSRTIYNSGQTLFQMVGNILAWSQIDGQMKPKFKNLNVGGEVEHVVAVYRLMAEEKGVKINVSIDDDIEVYADENHFNIIMRNLMSNALKYTPKGGRINISSLIHQGKTSIIVDDTGVGMSKSNVEKINKNMSVESTLGTQDEKGIGIGLAICSDLVKLNKGTFELRSIEGTGTSVALVFTNRT
ncbi:MAG: ATP-binding protein [Bacteroidales bacterium]|nr:ATP-binding protein [Bacteroidales bacterium]